MKMGWRRGWTGCYEKSHMLSSESAGGEGLWQEGAGGQDMGVSWGLVKGTAGYIRLRKESCVCRFTCLKNACVNSAEADGLRSG